MELFFEKNDKRKNSVRAKSFDGEEWERERTNQNIEREDSRGQFSTLSQLDQYIRDSYKMLTPMQIPTIFPAPEVVLENPSDSDSSRRVSHCSQSECSPTISATSSMSKLKQSMFKLNIPQQSSIIRRASHGGELLSPNNEIPGIHLDVPQVRERNCSLPSTLLTEEIYRMRNFSINGRKVVNHGDSVCSRRGSKTSVSSRGSR